MKRIEYNVCGILGDHSVKGYAVKFPAPGTYAVRCVGRKQWVVDHLETGFRFADKNTSPAPTPEKAILDALRLWRRKGVKQSVTAIRKATRKRSKMQLPITANHLEAA